MFGGPHSFQRPGSLSCICTRFRAFGQVIHLLASGGSAWFQIAPVLNLGTPHWPCTGHPDACRSHYRFSLGRCDSHEPWRCDAALSASAPAFELGLTESRPRIAQSLPWPRQHETNAKLIEVGLQLAFGASDDSSQFSSRALMGRLWSLLLDCAVERLPSAV